MSPPLIPGATGVLALADGTILQGYGVGAIGEAVGEVCFNTAMSGYQEILTDPSYMAQVVAFTFPHVGNVGVNLEDIEQFGQGASTSARGAIFRDLPTPPANWRAQSDLDSWLKRRGVVALTGVGENSAVNATRSNGGKSLSGGVSSVTTRNGRSSVLIPLHFQVPTNGITRAGFLVAASTSTAAFE